MGDTFLLPAAIFVFSMMAIGLTLTVLEFRATRRGEESAVPHHLGTTTSHSNGKQPIAMRDIAGSKGAM